MLNAYLKDSIAPALKGAGFEATGRVYRRAAGDALQIVEIENWKYNDAKRAKFTLEVGVCFPQLLAAVSELDAYAFYKECLAKPGITVCAVRRRLGMFLNPPQDKWWTVSATTGNLPPAEEIAVPLTTAAFPWMQSMSTLSALVSADPGAHTLRTGVMDVAALFALGQTSAATDAAGAMAKARHPNQPELAGKFLAELCSLERLRGG
jgi:hypothetical protein